MRETFDLGARCDAIGEGITSAAGVVTNAAVVMVAVFSIFAALSILFFKQFAASAFAAAILIDAALVRAVLLPATMKLLGDRTWYLARVAPLPRARGADGGPEARLALSA